MGFEERFKLRLPLGEGEVGAVWDAEDLTLGTAVAVALLEEDAPDAVRARFLEAAKVLTSLDHPSIVKVLDYGSKDDGSAFMAMELLRGQTLLERLSDGPPIRIELVVGMMIDLLEGLEKVHASGHVHGDVEPGNFVLVEDGAGTHMKLIGFGLNRAEARGGSAGEAADDGSEPTLRSFACMSPEQARREVVADVRGDVYGVGAVLYDAVTGRLPYRGTSVDEIRQAVASGGAKPVHEVRSELAGALAGAIDRAMSHKPMRRFADAGAMRKALRAALIMSPKVKGLDVAVSPRKLDRDSMVQSAPPPAGEAPEAATEATPEAAGEPVAPAPSSAAAASSTAEGSEGTAPAGPGGQPRTRKAKATMLGVAPPPAVMPPPAAVMPPPAAVMPARAKSTTAAKPVPPPAGAPPAGKAPAGTFSDESTVEISLSDISEVAMPPRAAPLPPRKDSTVKTKSAPPPPTSAPPQPVPGPSATPPSEISASAASIPIPAAPVPGEGASAAAPPEMTSRAIADETFDSGLVSLPASAPSRKLMIGGGLAAAAVLLIVIIATASGGNDEDPAVETAAPPQTERAVPEDEPEPAAAEAEVPEAEPEPEPEAEPETVVLAFAGVPPGASVTIDGQPVEGMEAQLPRDEATHEVRVTAEGFEPWTSTVRAADDTELAVEMEAIEEPEPERPAVAVQKRTPRRATPPRATRMRATRMRPTGMAPRVVRDPGF